MLPSYFKTDTVLDVSLAVKMGADTKVCHLNRTKVNQFGTEVYLHFRKGPHEDHNQILINKTMSRHHIDHHEPSLHIGDASTIQQVSC